MTPILTLSAALAGSARLASNATARIKGAFRISSSRVIRRHLAAALSRTMLPPLWRYVSGIWQKDRVSLGLRGCYGDARASLHLGERLHVADNGPENVAWTRQPRLVTLRDRRTAKPERDAGSIRPVGDLARRHDRARIHFSLYCD